jgi:hypothetical protein
LGRLAPRAGVVAWRVGPVRLGLTAFGNSVSSPTGEYQAAAWQEMGAPVVGVPVVGVPVALVVVSPGVAPTVAAAPRCAT